MDVQHVQRYQQQHIMPKVCNNRCEDRIRAAYMLEKSGDPVQLQHVLLPHVALQLLNALM